MSCKNSSISCQKNVNAWTKNLPNFYKHVNKRMPGIAKISDLSRMPQEFMIVNRFKYLARNEKSKVSRVKIIQDEIISLWNKFNFPILSSRSITQKLENLVKKHENYLKNHVGKYEMVFSEIFDITKKDGTWLSTEDKIFYKVQVESCGTVGYTTSKLASIKSIHPSKRRKIVSEDNSGLQNDLKPLSEEDKTDESDDDYLPHSEDNKKRKHRRSKTSVAVNLVTKNMLSTKKASSICKTLNDEGINLPTPSQSGIYKATFKYAEQMKRDCVINLKKENWSLHFDGKYINKKEYQVIVLKNSEKEFRLGVLELENSKYI